MAQAKTIATAKQDSAHRLRLLMFFRVVFVTFLLGATVAVQLREQSAGVPSNLTGLYVVIISIYLLTFIYALVLPRFVPVLAQGYIQSFGDVLMTTAIIYLTGGIDSIFSFMYILAIINASFILYRSGAFIISSCSVIMYGLMLDFQYYQYIEPFGARLGVMTNYVAADFLYRLLINMFAFYLVAYLAGYLSQQVEETRRELRATETDLKKLEGLNDSIVQSIDTGLLTLGSNDEILSINPAASKITGFAEYQTRGRPYSIIFKDLELPVRINADARRSELFPYNYTRPDGKTLRLEMGVQSLRDHFGNHWGKLLVFKDITRIYQMEEEVKRVEKLAAAGELATGMAHEIRNPLASMSGSIQMLENELSASDEFNPLITIIRREMDRLEHLVHDFLLFARPRVGMPKRQHASEVIEGVIKNFKEQIDKNKQITVKTDLEADVFVNFDPYQLEQVLWNLFQNASEAIPDSGTIDICLEKEKGGSSYARIMVKDTGLGISDEDRPHIFDPFYTTKQRGTGLGLSIISRIIEDGSGRITVSNDNENRTVFTIQLPLFA